jgi:hypothetical protein
MSNGENTQEMRSSAPSIAKQTGWKRPYPMMICQDIDVLQHVTKYDFDLSNADFRHYAKQRGVLYVAGVEGSPRWHFTGDFAKGRAEFMSDVYFKFSQEDPLRPGVRHKYTAEEMEFHWKVMCIARGKLQDAWELYRTIGLSAVAHQPAEIQEIAPAPPMEAEPKSWASFSLNAGKRLARPAFLPEQFILPFAEKVAIPARLMAVADQPSEIRGPGLARAGPSSEIHAKPEAAMRVQNSGRINREMKICQNLKNAVGQGRDKAARD